MKSVVVNILIEWAKSHDRLKLSRTHNARYGYTYKPKPGDVIITRSPLGSLEERPESQLYVLVIDTLGNVADAQPLRSTDIEDHIVQGGYSVLLIDNTTEHN